MCDPYFYGNLPQELRFFPRLRTDTFLGNLKTYLFVRTGLGALLSSYLEEALCKYLNE